MPRTIRVAHSPDSDDAFMFYALAEGKLDTGDLRYAHELSDIESLNQRARQAELEVTAVSIHAYAYLWRDYALLGSGSSMGDGYGPRLVSLRPRPADPRAALRGLRVGVPGPLTTAFLALKLYQPNVTTVVIPFDRIEEAVHHGEVDVGLLIHEGQLTYADTGLHLWADLGAWWLEETGLPLPLGGNVVRRDLGPAVIDQIARDLRASITRAPGLRPGPCPAVQPRHRRGADRHVRGDVREPVDGGLRAAGAPRRADSARPGTRRRADPGSGGGGLRRVIDPSYADSYLQGTLIPSENRPT
jgi:1,4-dihydroxy-6-naphthoate synthase